MTGDILYVDDQPKFIKPLAEFMHTETGRTVHIARSITAALYILKDPSMDIALVILDVIMANGDVPDIHAVDPLGHSTGLLAAPLLRPKLKRGAEIWLLTVRAESLTEEDLAPSHISPRRVYPLPIHDLQDFVNDLKTHLEGENE